MKRIDLEKVLRNAGFALLRQGGNHDVWRNPATGAQHAVPRHREISDYVAKAVMKALVPDGG